MLHSADDLKACKIQSVDGDLGKINDLYFDDEGWAIRYLVVTTHNWFFKREVLVSPIALDTPDWPNKMMPVNLSQKQVDHSPDISAHKPVSRQQEIKYFSYYSYPIYWGGTSIWGNGLYPVAGMLENDTTNQQPNTSEAKQDKTSQNNDPHLRSWQKVKGSVVNGSDGEIGHIQGLLIDEHTFAIRYVIVRANDWWIGHDILVAPHWFNDLKWAESSVKVNHTRAEIQGAPAYEPLVKMDRDWEIAMHDHYAREGYWSKESDLPIKQSTTSP
ncbi:PRC-barrel domain-containing protein [Pseudoalteromonas sp. SR41-8]|uniref:PRC-barrel domain-containing protein n=1 Tax=Pseudoalteromonas sp. SR41-8 TaxID=2760946 RepID=UPI0015FF22C4|nr:PRC-barrel domain-containing protein [Pseudoalteromonas sp. SR41-8]MBB1309474.1 PRC-barrel domain-containing protein [Pseudoalteromonas sp. SR41-8]